MSGEFTGTLIANKYRVDELITSTGFGELYRGTNTLLEKEVSIAAARNVGDIFFTEAKSAAKVDHASILALADFGTDSYGVGYAVYESAPAETLAEALGREGQFPVEMTVDIAKQLASGLAAAHQGGVIHGNLSPQNILVSSDVLGRITAKIFGFATPNAINDDRPDAQTGSRFAYLAPEQCSGADAADARGDVYSLGIILFEMLAGSVPFSGETPTDVMMRQIEEPPPPLSAFRQDLPPAIEPVIIRAMAKDPEARYQTANEFADDLTLALTGQPASVAAATAGGNNVWKTAFIVLVGISLLTFFMIYATSVKQTDPTTVQSDANGVPVQPINPATGIEEQNLSNLPPDYSALGANSNSAMPGTLPGGDGYNPWANGGAPPPGAPIQPGGQVIQVPQGQSPFMTDPNCIMQPSGILLCPVPVTPTPAPKATPTPKATPAANSNTGTPPATPTPRPAAAKTPAPAPRTPAVNKPDPNGDVN